MALKISNDEAFEVLIDYLQTFYNLHSPSLTELVGFSRKSGGYERYSKEGLLDLYKENNGEDLNLQVYVDPTLPKKVFVVRLLEITPELLQSLQSVLQIQEYKRLNSFLYEGNTV